QWSREDTSVLATGSTGERSLYQVPATGGQPVSLALAQSLGTTVPAYPAFLPDGRHFLYFATPSRTIWVGSIDSAETTRVVNADSHAQYVASPHLIFVPPPTLFAQPFDANAAATTGDPTAIAEQISADPLRY